jgi:N,N'-diacetyllegionaminate synthase
MMPFIIAEAGVNHNGDVERAIQMCAVASRAGCDAIKFQTFQAEDVVTASASKAKYQQSATGEGTQLEMIRALQLSWPNFVELDKECKRLGIRFLSTAFDRVSLANLNGLDLPMHKIASGEITNLPFLRCVGRYGKPVILSTGMATLGEIEAALDILGQAGTPRNLVTVLHCNTEYPTPMTDVNLRAMLTIGDALGVAVGYSDHTQGIEVAVAAAALGACVIEKHFTLDRNLPGPDHKASLEPAELNAMVFAIRNIEKALGDGIKRPSASEAINKLIVRRSLVAARSIPAGEVFSEINLTVKRPGTGLSPMRWDEVLGRTAPRNFAADELIEI